MIPSIRWLIPKKEVLEEVYPEGKPPFHPFLTVTEVVYAAFCPRAAYHYFLHALDPFRARGHEKGREGENYHKLICLLEQMMARGEEISWQIAEGLGIDLFGQEWRYIQPYVKNWWEKVKPIRAVKKGDELFFELWVAGELNIQGVTGLLLRGKVDEIDKSNKLIIERTTKRKELALAQFKDFQLWLLHQILKGIKDEDRPEDLRKEDFGRYRLILETPEEVVEVDDKRGEYQNRLISALMWIRSIINPDITTWREVFDASIKECRPGNIKKGCELAWACFQRGYKYPSKQVRNRMRKELASYWRSLIWQYMWRHHLHEYRLALMPYKKLQERGEICSGRVTSRRSLSLQELELEVELSSPEEAKEVEAQAKTSNEIQVLLYGTLRMGLRERGKVVEIKGNRIKLFFEGVIARRIPNTVLFLSTPSDIIFIGGEEPVFLERGTQRDVYLYTTRGTNKETRAKKGGQFALLEAIFGTKRVAGG
jgi:hypothetical protein